MTPLVSLRLIGDSVVYQPGDTLTGEYFVDIADPREIKAVEVSALWFTEGKGDEDMAVHQFDRTANDDGHFADFRQTRRFESRLPPSPLSYDGAIVKIQWCVRVRVFLGKGKELVAERPFQLGSIPRVRPWQFEQQAAAASDNGGAPADADQQSSADQQPRERQPELQR
jgi:hypothetical protein